MSLVEQTISKYLYILSSNVIREWGTSKTHYFNNYLSTTADKGARTISKKVITFAEVCH